MWNVEPSWSLWNHLVIVLRFRSVLCLSSICFGYFAEAFAADLVDSLCTSKGDVLDKFVSDMLDVDSK